MSHLPPDHFLVIRGIFLYTFSQKEVLRMDSYDNDQFLMLDDDLFFYEDDDDVS